MKIVFCLSFIAVSYTHLQGCSLSPYLFNLFIEEVVTQMKRSSRGIKINGEWIHSICFADDIVLMADSEKDMTRDVYKRQLLYNHSFC